MKSQLSRRAKVVLFASALCVTIALAGGLTLAALHSNQQSDAAQDQLKKMLRLQLERGVVAQVQLAQRGDSTDKVRASVESVASFIHRRSGLTLSDAAKEKLTSLEQESLNNPQKRISIQDLIDILATTASERLASLTDDEISQMREIMDKGSPDKGANAISLRGNGTGSMSHAEFTAAVNYARAVCRKQNSFFQKVLQQTVADEVNERVNQFNEYAPSHFGDIKQNGVTPLQAVLIAYSVTADDPLAHSQETLEAQEQAVYNRFPNAVKRKPPFIYPYGSEGYRFATPLDIILDEATMQKLINRMAREEN